MQKSLPLIARLIVARHECTYVRHCKESAPIYMYYVAPETPMMSSVIAEIFERPFLGVFRKKIQHFPKKFHLSPKISDDIFCFNVLFFRRGVKSVADIDTGGEAKSLHFDKFTMLSLGLLFLPPRGAKLHC